jgi:spermidine/putrescine transport system permease protein
MTRGMKRLSIPYIVWMAIFVVAPIFIVLIYAVTSSSGAFTAANFSNMLSYSGVFARSMWLAFIATVICLVIGYPAAYILSRLGPGAQKICMMLVILPMWINSLLRTYAWMSILENTGLLNRFFRAIGLLDLLGIEFVPMINTPGAVGLGMVYDFLPFMILPIYSVLVKMDYTLVEAAEDLGATPAKVFTKVTLPLSVSGVVSGVTMVFVPAISTFVISRLLGGGSDMLLGDLIEMQFLGTAYNPHLGSAISIVMMVIVVICMSLMNRFGDGEEGAIPL